jgi:hypothetical protein
MAQPTGYPVPLHRAANRFRDHQPDARSIVGTIG